MPNYFSLTRRGFDLGTIEPKDQQSDSLERWQTGKPIFLPKLVRSEVDAHQHQIAQTEALVESVWNEERLDETLAQPPYSERLLQSLDNLSFDNLGSGFNEGDDQEIETVFFDAVDANEQTIAEDLWLKCSWLSFFDEDASLRFRFSFGVDLEQDVALDPLRQHHASQLCDLVFPESSIIGNHAKIKATLQTLMNKPAPQFVERIIYFNAPQGGAYFHHDLERGHAGVVYAQLSGATLWLALPRHELISAIIAYSQTHRVTKSVAQLCESQDKLATALESFAHDELIHLINETPTFIHFLHEQGHSRVLESGDVILLPQNDWENACWHSVFCLSEHVGQALSFAVR